MPHVGRPRPGPKSIAAQLPIKPTRASKAGVNYRAANGTQIKNYGEKHIEGYNNNGRNTGITVQVADVSKVLAGTSKVCDAGNIQVFTKSGGYIISEKEASHIIAAIDKAKGKIAMRRAGGTYVYDIWVKSGESVNSVASKEEDDIPPPPGISHARPVSVKSTGSRNVREDSWATICRHSGRCSVNCNNQPFAWLGPEMI